MNTKRHRKLVGLTALLFFICGMSVTVGQDMPVSGEAQGALFKKIFSYDKTLAGEGQTTVFIVGADKNDKAVKELVTAFDEAGMFAAIIEDSVLSDSMPSKTVVYVMPGADKDRLKLHCAQKGILTISGYPVFAEEGHVSVSLDRSGSGTSQVIVNMQRLKAEGHQLSADLLKLARVVR